MKAGIVDYRTGNLASVSKALERAGAQTVISDDAADLDECDLLVLPGVGNFSAGMRNLLQLDLAGFVTGWARAERPLLGICLGMQLLFEESEEGSSKGLGIIPGKVVKLDGSVKVPHMGWNTIEAIGGSRLFGEFSGRSFYFVHSYVCSPTVLNAGASTTYGQGFASAVEYENTCGVQFHPEKSSTDGLALLKQILASVA